MQKVQIRFFAALCLLWLNRPMMHHYEGKETRSLKTLRAVIMSLAVYNFWLVWSFRGRGTLDFVIRPWYKEWSFSNEPSLLLLAAGALWIGRRGGYLVAIVVSSLVVAGGIAVNADLFRYGLLIPTWSELATFHTNPFLLLPTQFSFGVLIFITAVYLDRKEVKTRLAQMTP